MQKKTPIIATNAHHKAVKYWFLKQLKDKDLKGLPIIHFDSHTDMGHIPSHFAHNGQFLSSQSLLDPLSKEKIESFQESLTDISQVIIPAVASGLSKEIHMCMPEWFTRIDTFNKFLPFSIITLNKALFFKSKTHRIYPSTVIPNTFASSPFIHTKKSKSDAKIIFYQCFKEPEIQIESDYILSLDLDFFVSNGEEGDHARPTSFHRSKSEHISQSELSAFNQRIRKFKNLILQFKERGYLPKIVTISDSTRKEGGDYTPTPLAYLAHK